MRAADLLRRIEEPSFRPFRIHVSDGTMIDIKRPGMVIIGLSSAVLPTRFTKDETGAQVASDWRTVALSHMVQFSDIEENGHRSKSSRKRK
jgi:hypothetical protein